MNSAYKTVMVLFFASFIHNVAHASHYVGIILEGYQENCIVQSSNAEYDCSISRHLFVGDKVVKKPNSSELKIKYAPYASGKKLSETTLQVDFQPPENNKGIVQRVEEFLGFIKTEHIVTIGATRGDSDYIRVPQPNNNATVIPGYKITFNLGSGLEKYIVFKDSNGANILRKGITEKAKLQLTPEEIGMKPHEVYTWSIIRTENNKQYKIRLLNNSLVKQIVTDLNDISRQYQNETDKRIRKAAYLQFMSNTYREDIDLYWLSYQIMEEIEDRDKLSNDNMVILEEIRRNYLEHVIDMLQ